VAVVPKAELAAALSQPIKTEEAKTTVMPGQPIKKEEEKDDGEDGEPSWPPRGITIIAGPSADSPGAYR
jgi:hypothetical protein